MGNKHSVEDEELYNEIKSSHTFPSSEGATFTLGDGRKLGYMEYGNKDSKNVILFFHPTPGCRLFCPPVKQQNVRVIVVERPGFGLSTPKKEFKFLDWPQDIIEFTDGLKIEKFGLIAWSGGAPFAWACLYKIPERIVGAVVVSSTAPKGVPNVTDDMPFVFKLAWWSTSNCKPLLHLGIKDEASSVIKHPVHGVKKGWSEYKGDINYYKENRDIQKQMVICSWEAYSRPETIEAVYKEYTLYGAPWGYEVSDIKHPNITFYHGKLDTGCTTPMAKYLADKIPGMKSNFVDGIGHLVFFKIWDDAIDHLSNLLASGGQSSSSNQETEL